MGAKISTVSFADAGLTVSQGNPNTYEFVARQVALQKGLKSVKKDLQTEEQKKAADERVETLSAQMKATFEAEEEFTTTERSQAECREFAAKAAEKFELSPKDTTRVMKAFPAPKPVKAEAPKEEAPKEETAEAPKTEEAAAPAEATEEAAAPAEATEEAASPAEATEEAAAPAEATEEAAEAPKAEETAEEEAAAPAETQEEEAQPAEAAEEAAEAQQEQEPSTDAEEKELPNAEAVAPAVKLEGESEAVNCVC